RSHRWLAYAASAVWSISAPSGAVAASRTYLASIQGIKLRAKEYVSAFKVDTWGVTFKAVCHIPPGWSIKAGNTASFDGALSGEGSHSITYFDRAHLRESRGLVSISIDGPVQRRVKHTQQSTIPPTFDGAATVGRYAAQGIRNIKLTHANVALVPGSRCPAAGG
ncbi:hypothetical protein OY671_008630, partial [Metschnikowia pulcherrima]